MTQANLVIELDTKKIYLDRSKRTWHFASRARLPEYKLERVGEDIDKFKKMCREAISLGCDPERLVEIKRGDMVCFKLAAVDAWANPPDRRPESLKK